MHGVETSPLDYSDDIITRVSSKRDEYLICNIRVIRNISLLYTQLDQIIIQLFQLTVFSLLTFFCVTFHTSACRRASFEFCFLWNINYPMRGNISDVTTHRSNQRLSSSIDAKWITSIQFAAVVKIRLYFEVPMAPLPISTEEFSDKIVKSYFSCFMWGDINVTDCGKWAYYIISYHRPLNWIIILYYNYWIESKLCCGRLCDIGKYRVVVQRIIII